MPVEGRGKPLPPALGGWRPGFLPSVEAKVSSRPQIQGIVDSTTLYRRMCHEVHPPGVLGESGNQDIIKTAFLLKMESQGDAGNLHITRPLLSDHVWWAWTRSTLQSISSISCRRPSQSTASLEKAEAHGTGENFAEPPRARAKVFLGPLRCFSFLIGPHIRFRDSQGASKIKRWICTDEPEVRQREGKV
jgi:hypothetical protein